MKDKMKIGEYYKIGKFDKYFKPNSKLLFSTYDGLSGRVLKLSGRYAYLWVEEKYNLYHKYPMTKVPKIQCEKLVKNNLK